MADLFKFEDLLAELKRLDPDVTCELLMSVIEDLEYQPHDLSKNAALLISAEVLELRSKSKALSISPQGDRVSQGIELRSKVESGELRQSDLTLAQADLVLETIELDEKAGKVLDDKAVTIFYQLSDRLEQSRQLLQAAQQIGAAVEDNDQKVVATLNRLAKQANRNDVVMADHFDGLARSMRGGMDEDSFRQNRKDFITRITDIVDSATACVAQGAPNGDR